MSKTTGGDDRPTMEAVARLAGVSKITVSRALRGSDLVRPELREHIREVARKAGYRLNVAARSLRTRRTQTIAVVVEKLVASDRPVADPLVLTLIGGLLEELSPAGYALLLTTSDYILGSDTIGADGVIMIGEGENGIRAREVAGLGLPTVVWGAPLAGANFSVVGSDNREGGRLAASHLVEAGRRRMIFLGDVRHPEVSARHEGVRDILAASPASLVAAVPCEFSRSGGVEAIEDALARGLEFDAVIAASDYIAAGACGLLMDRGLTVPGKVAVIGFDDNAVAGNHRPPLSSIRQDWSAAGRLLGRALMDRLADPASPVTEHVLPVELVVRETTAAATP